jgi:hypothetical protein
VGDVGEQEHHEGGMGVGQDDAMKDVNVQKLLKEFENISSKEGETIDDFGMRINSLVANLKTLGEMVDDT